MEEEDIVTPLPTEDEHFMDLVEILIQEYVGAPPPPSMPPRADDSFKSKPGVTKLPPSPPHLRHYGSSRADDQAVKEKRDQVRDSAAVRAKQIAEAKKVQAAHRALLKKAQDKAAAAQAAAGVEQNGVEGPREDAIAMPGGDASRAEAAADNTLPPTAAAAATTAGGQAAEMGEDAKEETFKPSKGEEKKLEGIEKAWKEHEAEVHPTAAIPGEASKAEDFHPSKGEEKKLEAIERAWREHEKEVKQAPKKQLKAKKVAAQKKMVSAAQAAAVNAQKFEAEARRDAVAAEEAKLEYKTEMAINHPVPTAKKAKKAKKAKAVAEAKKIAEPQWKREALEQEALADKFKYDEERSAQSAFAEKADLSAGKPAEKAKKPAAEKSDPGLAHWDSPKTADVEKVAEPKVDNSEYDDTQSPKH